MTREQFHALKVNQTIVYRKRSVRIVGIIEENGKRIIFVNHVDLPARIICQIVDERSVEHEKANGS